MKVYLVTFKEVCPITGGLKDMVSHGIREDGQNVVLPWDELLKIPRVKYDVSVNEIYIEDEIITEENNNEI